MKKTALTFGLLSLVMVATSFANPKITSTDSVDPNGGYTGPPGKKLDIYAPANESTFGKNVDFVNVNQSLGSNKKVD